MKQIRHKCFETNSSSTHALCIGYNFNNNIPKPERLIENGNIVLKYDLSDILHDYNQSNIRDQITNFDEKLYYLIGCANELNDNFKQTERICKIVEDYFHIKVKFDKGSDKVYALSDSNLEEIGNFLSHATDEDIKNFLFCDDSLVNIVPIGDDQYYGFIKDKDIEGICHPVITEDTITKEIENIWSPYMPSEYIKNELRRLISDDKEYNHIINSISRNITRVAEEEYDKGYKNGLEYNKKVLNEINEIIVKSLNEN